MLQAMQWHSKMLCIKQTIRKFPELIKALTYQQKGIVKTPSTMYLATRSYAVTCIFPLVETICFTSGKNCHI